MPKAKLRAIPQFSRRFFQIHPAGDFGSGAFRMSCDYPLGVAANYCFKTGQPVKIADLVTGLEMPMPPVHQGGAST